MYDNIIGISCTYMYVNSYINASISSVIIIFMQYNIFNIIWGRRGGVGA